MKIYYDIWMSVVMGPGCSNSRQIAETVPDAQTVYDNRKNLSEYGVFTERQLEKAAATDLADIRKIRELHIANGINSVTAFDENYPHRFKNTYNQPLVLFYKGDLSLLDSRCTVGVVGSRHCSGEGEKACTVIAKDIAQNGGVIVSGLAQGIDTIAHKACVSAGGRTVAFTGVPLDECFPKTNRDFQSKLSREHLVVSEYCCTTKYYSSNFIQRNRLIAAASDGLCVVQAKKKSGSLATVKWAMEYDKPVFTVPGSIFDTGYEGSNRLIIENKANAVSDGLQIMEHLGYAASNKTKKKKLPPVSDMAKQVLAVIDKPMFTSRILKKAALPAGIVKAAIIELEVAGYIAKADSGEYIRCQAAG